MRDLLAELWELFTLWWGWLFPNRRRFKSINARLDYIERMQRAIWDLLHERQPTPRDVHRLANRLKESNDALAAALLAQGIPLKRSAGVFSMNPLQPLIDEVTRTQGVAASAIALLNGIQGKIQAAVDAALAGGATGQQVAEAVGAVLTNLKSSTDALAAAVDANDD